MKKLLVILLFLITPFLIFAEEDVTYIQGEMLIIPPSYAELRQAYIDMAEAYLKTNDALTKALENNDTLLEANKQLNILLDKSQANTEEAIKNTEELMVGQDLLIDDMSELVNELEYWMNKKHYISIAGSVILVNNAVQTEPQIGIGVNVEIINRFYTSLYYLPIDKYAISVGYRLFSY